MDTSTCLPMLLALLAAVSVRASSVAAGGLRPVCCTKQDISILERQAARTWPNEIIPYQFSQQLSGDMKRRLLSVMQESERSSCVIFTPHSIETDYASFEMGERCCSTTGYTGDGKQDVLLGTPCMKPDSEGVLNNIIQLLAGKHDSSVNTQGPKTGISGIVDNREVYAITNHSCNATCGGYIVLDPSTNQIEQQLATPQYPQPYKPYLDCVWKLVAPEGYALTLMFKDLDMEDRQCQNDFVRIQHLDSTGQVLRMSLLCGTPDPETLNEPSGYDYNTSAAVIHFHSDSSYGGRGMLLGYSLKERRKVIVDPCSVNNGGCVHLCTSNAFGGHSCSCRLGYRLTRKGRCLDINECKLNNGGCSQKCINTEGSFTCDCRTGYRLDSFDLVSCHSCNAHFNQSSGTLVSPGYPTKYLHHQNCRWSVHRWANYHLKITVTNLDISYSQTCKHDFLKLRPSHFPNKGRLCGHYRRIEYYLEDKLEVRFRTKGISKHHYHSGFVLEFKQVWTDELDPLTVGNVTINNARIPFEERVWSL